MQILKLGWKELWDVKTIIILLEIKTALWAPLALR